jgi:transcriptional regulator with XRE-family HTH domain
MSLGQKITRLRKALKFSQNELGKRIGTSGDIIGRYERDEVNPSIEVASKIAESLSVSLDYLVCSIDFELDTTIINRVVQIQALPVKDREHILYTLDSLLASVKAREAFG